MSKIITYNDIYDMIEGLGVKEVVISKDIRISIELKKSIVRPTGRRWLYIDDQFASYSMTALDLDFMTSTHNDIAHLVINRLEEMRMEKIINEVLDEK